ncbi:hypothetical protein CLAIMM_14392 [Cladophialophora immunda]|nr:hypothetical protein CLAIMM_14392 [Cladophialophora immunda]
MSPRTPPPPASANATERPFEENRKDTGADYDLTNLHDQTYGHSETHEHPPSQAHTGQTHNVHFENVSADEDTQQVIVSGTQEGIYGKDIRLKARGTQWLGQVAQSIQCLSEDRTAVLLGIKEDKASKDNASYNRTYGPGRRLDEN